MRGQAWRRLGQGLWSWPVGRPSRYDARGLASRGALGRDAALLLRSEPLARPQGGPHGAPRTGRLTGPLFQLLTVNPQHRMSSLRDVQAAPALADVLWAELSEKKVEPGFVPNVSLRTWGRGTGHGAASGGLSTVPHRKAACTATPPSSWRR